jgi:predicted dehydrogenase
MTIELGVGIAGLGAATEQTLPAFAAPPKGVRLAGAADLRAEARDDFARNYGLPTYDSVEKLCAAPDVHVVWVSTPNPVHCEHVLAAAAHGKHVICEKPMAVTLEQCDRMVEACAKAGVKFIQGHSKIFDSPVRAMREVVASGRLGQVLQITSWNYNNWLQRPRLATEVDTTLGGGLVYRQGPHHIDIVRYIAGGIAKTVRGVAGRADPHFDTEGHFSALIAFENGACATLGFNGYGYFDIVELTWNIGEGGGTVPDPRTRKPRPRVEGPLSAEEKYSWARTAGPAHDRGAGPRRMPFFGLTIVACERGHIRQSPDGLYVYTAEGCEELPIAHNAGREAELVELVAALEENRPAFPDAAWGRATLEVCLGILQSSREGREIALTKQVPAR